MTGKRYPSAVAYHVQLAWRRGQMTILCTPKPKTCSGVEKARRYLWLSKCRGKEVGMQNYFCRTPEVDPHISPDTGHFGYADVFSGGTV